MQTIRLSTWVNAPVERCFRLAACVELTEAALGRRRAQSADGMERGAMAAGKTVTWRGWYLGRWRRHESLIEVWRPFSYFRSVMVRGSFAQFEHEHHFAARDGGTRIRDEVRFRVPLWSGGRMVEGVVQRYVTRLLRQRNAAIKAAAESEAWRRYLAGAPGTEASR